MRADVRPSLKRVGVAEAAARLAEVSETPRLDAELLMAHALGVSRETLLLGRFEPPPGFHSLVARRMTGEPIAYIIGTRDFWTITLEVGPGVLIPRPDSETLIEAAVAHFAGGSGPARILDLGTGSGALLLAALDHWPDATGIGVDASEAALKIATRNAARIAPGRATMRVGDWTDGLEERFDLILCNPPYVQSDAELPKDVRDFEPATALFSGADGLECYRRIVPELPRLLSPGGMIALEIGHTQAEAVSALFTAAGFSPQIRNDLAARPRAIVHFALGNATPAV